MILPIHRILSWPLSQTCRDAALMPLLRGRSQTPPKMKYPQSTALALVCAFTLLATATPATAADPGQAAPQELPIVTVIGSSPVVGTGVPINLYPGNAQTISSKSLSPGTSTLTDALNNATGSVNVNDTEGNPYQMDLNFRGYTASPVLGTPQGVSVYVDGIRVNEPFGDVVSWDLIPEIAISNITVIPGTNPVYGLNTLGGALAVNTKSGFAYPGTTVSFETGSFDRRSINAEYGGHEDNTDFYIASSFFDDNGWAKNNPSLVRQLFAKVGYQGDQLDLDFSITYVDDYLAGNQLVAHSMIEDAISGYSHPDYQSTHSFAANLTSQYQLNATNTIEGNVYYRNIWRLIYDSNINDAVVPGSPGQQAFCIARFGEFCAGNVASQYTQNVYGLNLQYSNHEQLMDLPQYFSIGLNSEYARTTFLQSGQDAIVTSDFATIGFDPFTPQSNIRSTNSTVGVYATDTIVLDNRWSVTLSARQDHSSVSLSGTSIDSNNDAVVVAGSHTYQRLNPALGGTFAITSETTLFANYAEGFRTPSAIELACADPVHPCAGVPSAFSSDPALKAVIAKSVEFGARGKIGADLNWRAAAFYSNLSDDIIFNQSTLTTGFFSNVGRTRREGVEWSMDGKMDRFDFAASTTLLNATYQSSFEVADGTNVGSVCPGPACVPVRPGDKIPGIPDVIGKIQLGYRLAESTHIEALIQAQSSTFARGDENNLATNGKIPGYATVKVDFTQTINKTLELYGGISNLFNRLYANFGMLSNNGLKGNLAENFWAVGQPRTFFVGLRGSL
jgi:iron complex outermembrane receptor protein